MPDNRRFLLQRRPDGDPLAADFELVTQPTPDLDEGQFLIRNHYASLDPAMRGWMDAGGNYMPPVPLGSAMRASRAGRTARGIFSRFLYRTRCTVSGVVGTTECCKAESRSTTGSFEPVKSKRIRTSSRGDPWARVRARLFM